MNVITNTISKHKVLILVTFVIALILIPTTFILANDGNVAEKVPGGIVDKVLWGITNGVFGFFVWLGGKLLNTAITDFVVGFGDLYITTGLGFAVEELWKMVRDIFNLMFIFGLVYIGFKMILDSADSNARKMLVNIILAALLVNFSLFFTKFIIDFTNIAAIQVAQAFTHNPTSSQYQVSDAFIRIYGLQTIWGTQDFDLGSFTSGQANSYTYIFGTMILFLVTAFVFFAGGLLLIIRFVILNFFMILSPVMFLGWVFPGLAHYSRSYWTMFLGRAFFAPAYIFLLYISYKIFTEFGSITEKANLNGVFNAAGGAPSKEDMAVAIPFFIIMCTFLIASIIIGQKMGADGASYAVSAGNRFSKRASKTLLRGAGHIGFGIPAVALQKTAGAGAAKLADNKSLRNWSNKYAAARGVRKGLLGVSDKSFDARNALGLGTAIGVGGGIKGGYATAKKKKADEEKAYAKTLEKETRDAFGNLIPEVENSINQVVTQRERALADAKSTQEADRKAKIDQINNDENRAQIESDIKSLQSQLDLVKDNPEETNRINSEIAARQQNIKNIDERIAKETEVYDKEIKSLDKDIKEFESKGREKMKKEEEARIKYQDVIAHREKLERENTTGRNVIKAGAVTATAIAATAAAIPLALAAGVTVAAATWNKGINKAKAEALAKEYGVDGTKKATKEKQRDNMRLLAEIQKEDGATEQEKPASDTEGSSESSKNA